MQSILPARLLIWEIMRLISSKITRYFVSLPIQVTVQLGDSWDVAYYWGQKNCLQRLKYRFNFTRHRCGNDRRRDTVSLAGAQAIHPNYRLSLTGRLHLRLSTASRRISRSPGPTDAGRGGGGSWHDTYRERRWSITRSMQDAFSQLCTRFGVYWGPAENWLANRRFDRRFRKPNMPAVAGGWALLPG